MSGESGRQPVFHAPQEFFDVPCSQLRLRHIERSIASELRMRRVEKFPGVIGRTESVLRESGNTRDPLHLRALVGFQGCTPFESRRGYETIA